MPSIIGVCFLETSAVTRKTSDDILLYLLNTSLSHDIILIETPFPQFYIVLCSELSLCLSLCDLFHFFKGFLLTSSSLLGLSKPNYICGNHETLRLFFLFK